MPTADSRTYSLVLHSPKWLNKHLPLGLPILIHQLFPLIEDTAQFERQLTAGCHGAQGPLVGRPVPLGELLPHSFGPQHLPNAIREIDP